jgi:hypothetical protein
VEGRVITYDSGIIEKYAARLYRQARVAIVLYALMMGVVGVFGSASAFGGGLSAFRSGSPKLVVPIAGGVLGILLGTAIGIARAFTLRLQAQVALCQVQIEKNTRGVGRST